MNWARLLELARGEVVQTVARLPAELRVRAEALPVAYERAPNPEVFEGASETLGRFVGGEFAEEQHVLLPAHIILYLENIWDEAEHDEDFFREEVRITFMHELGHYLGLDEDDLDERGL